MTKCYKMYEKLTKNMTKYDTMKYIVWRMDM